ncbi:MAG: M20/M25/M40 family metallo-hydrolase, partial [Deltaproteobacteria bacterium]|nr:M20/M25/M40 family metallo-hydrolase [Deltaproteobacteria bacterium]
MCIRDRPYSELGFDIRLLPGVELEALREEILRRAKEAVKGMGVELRMASIAPAIPPFENSNTSLLVRAVEKLLGEAAGTASFATEAPFYELGGWDVVVLGPGEIESAHQPNERLSLTMLHRAVEVYASLITRFCIHGVDGG